jgi:hypothetical protein
MRELQLLLLRAKSLQHHEGPLRVQRHELSRFEK